MVSFIIHNSFIYYLFITQNRILFILYINKYINNLIYTAQEVPNRQQPRGKNDKKNIIVEPEPTNNNNNNGGCKCQLL